MVRIKCKHCRNGTEIVNTGLLRFRTNGETINTIEAKMPQRTIKMQYDGGRKGLPLLYFAPMHGNEFFRVLT